MTFRVRPARGEDAAAIYQMAELTGGGFTNLPADHKTIAEKLERSDRSFCPKWRRAGRRPLCFRARRSQDQGDPRDVPDLR